MDLGKIRVSTTVLVTLEWDIVVFGEDENDDETEFPSIRLSLKEAQTLLQVCL